MLYSLLRPVNLSTLPRRALRLKGPNARSDIQLSCLQLLFLSLVYSCSNTVFSRQLEYDLNFHISVKRDVTLKMPTNEIYFSGKTIG